MDTFRIYGNVTIEGNNVTTLPENLSVEGFLDIEKTSISEIPRGLLVYDDLYLNTHIKEVPEDTLVLGNIYRAVVFKKSILRAAYVKKERL